MTAIQLKIIQSAVAIRVRRGEDILYVLETYPKLSQEERVIIYNNLMR